MSARIGPPRRGSRSRFRRERGVIGFESKGDYDVYEYTLTYWESPPEGDRPSELFEFKVRVPMPAGVGPPSKELMETYMTDHLNELLSWGKKQVDVRKGGWTRERMGVRKLKKVDSPVAKYRLLKPASKYAYPHDKWGTVPWIPKVGKKKQKGKMSWRRRRRWMR